MQEVVVRSMRQLLTISALGGLGLVACTPGGRSGDVDASAPPGSVDGAPVPDAFVPPVTGPPYPDFPAAPIVDTGAPVNAGDLFGAADQPNVAGPCLAEPQVGTLFPNGFLRPRFTVVGSGGQNLFEIRLHADDEANDLVVYTTNPQWKLPGDIWAKMSLHLADVPITVTIRGAVLSGAVLTSGPALGTRGAISIAPVGATGSIVYWTTSGGTALKGFKMGQESVDVVLRPKNAGIADPGCIGCHTLTPDGKYLSFSWVVGPDGFAGQIDLREPLAGESTIVAARPPFLSAAALTLLSRKAQHAPVYSRAHWSDHDHIAITMLQSTAVNDAPTDIIWTDLEATSMAENVGWGRITRGGDPHAAAAAANFSHDGKTIVYVSGTGIDSGVRNHSGDIFTVPYNNRLGGPVTKVEGASDPVLNESYPSFSADDQLIAFTRSNNAADDDPAPSYDNPNAEIWVVPAGGGASVRLVANDANSCGGGTSPGLTNSWPKWSPGPVDQQDGKKYYWLTFSSRRGNGLPQIYVAPVVRTETGLLTYPAIYMWNQPANEANHTPAWDQLQIQ